MHDFFHGKTKNPRTISRTKVIMLCQRDGAWCNYCGERKNLTVDHKIPVSMGGTSELENLQLLCHLCNTKKGHRMRWFQHDSDANTDPKLINLADKWGAEGLGVYWVVVEKIAQRLDGRNVTMELEEEVHHIARIFGGRTPTDRVAAILVTCEELGLFRRGPNGRIQCPTLLKKLDTVATRNETIKAMRDEMRRFEPSSHIVRRPTLPTGHTEGTDVPARTTPTAQELFEAERKKREKVG